LPKFSRGISNASALVFQHTPNPKRSWPMPFCRRAPAGMDNSVEYGLKAPCIIASVITSTSLDFYLLLLINNQTTLPSGPRSLIFHVLHSKSLPFFTHSTDPTLSTMLACQQSPIRANLESFLGFTALFPASHNRYSFPFFSLSIMHRVFSILVTFYLFCLFFSLYLRTTLFNKLCYKLMAYSISF